MQPIINQYENELKSAGLIALLKAYLVMRLCMNEGAQSQRALEKGMTLNKHPFSAANGNDVIWLNPNDIECFWTEGPAHFVRTKTGKDFEVSEASWAKVRWGVDTKL